MYRKQVIEVEDGQLVRGVQAGDEQAVRQLMQAYGTELCRTAALLLRDRHLAEDIAQEVFLKAVRSIGQFQGTGSLRSWLLRITINECRSVMRRHAWKRLIFRERAGEDQAGVGYVVPEQAADQMALAAAIGQLDYKYKEAIILFYYQELTVKEIAALLRVPDGTIKSRLQRGRTALRAILGEEGWDDAGQKGALQG